MTPFLYLTIPYALGSAVAVAVVSLTYWFLRFRALVRRCEGIPVFGGLSWMTYYKMAKNFTRNKNIPAECYIFQFICSLCQLYKGGFVLFWILFKPTIFCYKAEVIKELIGHSSVLKKPQEYVVLKSYLGLGLITSNGDIWSEHRKVIAPAFHLKVLKEYFSVFNEQGSTLVRKLKELSDESWIDISKYTEFCTFDVICETAMGIQTGCQTGNQKGKTLLTLIDELESIATYRAMRPWTHNEFLFRFSSIGRRMHHALGIANKLGNEVIDKKQKPRTKRKGLDNETKGSFTERLLQYRDQNSGFTMENIQDEVRTFITAGYDTTAMTLRWTLFLLGHHPDEQERLFQELNSVFDGDAGRSVTYHDLKDLTYLDCVLKESMRVYSPVPIVARELSDDVRVGKYTLPRGSTVVFNFYVLHKDLEYFPEPEKFKPERFFPENIPNIHPFAYLPFSSGPRNCIGQKYALMEVKVLLCHVLRNFRLVSVDSRDRINTIWGISLKNVEPIRIRLIPRDKFPQQG